MVTCKEHLFPVAYRSIEKQPPAMVTHKSHPPGEPGKYQQILAAVAINLGGFAYGIMVGWPSPMTPQLQSDDPPVGTEPMSNEAASWLGGALCLGGLFGTPLFAAMAEKFGRKTTGCLMAVPHGVCWILTVFAQDENYLFVARFFAGIAGAGSLLVVPLYVGEIASNNIRGMLGSLITFFISIGILASYVIGMFVSFRVFAICACVVPMVYLAAFVFMPETPVYLIRCDRMSEAGRSLLWLRGGNKQIVDRELVFLSSIAKESLASQKKVGLMDLFKDRATIKGVLISFGLLGGQQLCGIFAMISYAAPIFKAAGSSLSPDMSAVIVGVIQVFGCYLSTVLVERAGRRLLVLISCSGMCVCLCALGAFSYLQNNDYEVAAFSWIPVVALSLYIVVYSLGMGPVPFVVASEVFSPEIASLANSVALVFLWILAFLVVKFFATLSALIGIYGCFFLFAGFCASTFIFELILVPETKGKTLDAIIHELNGSSTVKTHSKDNTKKDTFRVIDAEKLSSPTQV